MKKLFFLFLFVFISCNLFAYERFDSLFGIERGMSRTEVKKIAEADNWLLLSETDSELYFRLSFNKGYLEGFYGVNVPQFVVFFQNGVSGFILVTDAKEKATVDKIINELDKRYGLEYFGIYKNYFTAWKMKLGGNILMSWETSQSMLTNETSEYAQFTINLN